MDGHAVDEAVVGDVDMRDQVAGGGIEHVHTHDAGHPDGVGFAVKGGDLGNLARSLVAMSP